MAKKKDKKKNKKDVDKKLDKSDSKEKKKPVVARRVKNSIIAVVLLGVALLMVLAYFSSAGVAGSALLGGAEFLFGKGNVIVPIGFFVGGLAILRTLKKPPIGIIIGMVIFMISSLGLMEVVVGQEKTAGIIGFWIAKPMLSLFDKGGSIVVLLVTWLISILLGLNLSLTKKKKKEVDPEHPEEAPEPEKKQESLLGKLTGGGVTKKPIFTLSELPKKGRKTSTKSKKKDSDAGQMGTFEDADGYEFPDSDMLIKGKKQGSLVSANEIQSNIKIIKDTLENFGIEVAMGEVSVGPRVTQYTLKPSSGIKLSQIVALQNDLALALAAQTLRIEAPIPGKSYMGIEVPNKKIEQVLLRDMLEDPQYIKARSNLTVALGKDVSGKTLFDSLQRMPHILIAGTTGSGKSVAVHNLIMTFLFQNSPKSLRFIMIDPKRVELSLYNNIPHLLSPVIVDHHKAIGALKWVVKEMDNRYNLLSELGVQDVYAYNKELMALREKAAKSDDEKYAKFKERDALPLIVVIIDEMADLMVRYGREVEQAVIRLAQMARAVGIHLILSTQRPSVNVITGLIKANISYRVAFKVASQIDSRTILDKAGAEKLLGKGDMLFLSGDRAEPRRVQGVFVSNAEISKVAKFLRDQHIKNQEESLEFEEKPNMDAEFTDTGDEDDLYDEALKVVMQAKKASASLLQRRLKVGYARAARILDTLEERGVVGPQEGSKPREVLTTSTDEPE